MTWLDLTHALVVGCYLAGTVLVLVGMATGNRRLKTLASVLALAGFVAHGADLAQALRGDTALLAAGFYLSFIAWVLLALYLVVWWRFRSPFLSLTALPLGLITYASSLAADGFKVMLPPALTGLFFGLHIGVLALALGLMALAFGAALAFLHVNRRIKSKASLTNLDKGMGSLETFDRINHFAVVAGFVLYTLGLVSSFAWILLTPGKKLIWDVMNVGALGVWLLFAVTFHQRLALGWKGRKPAIMAILVFLCMVVTLLHHTITFSRMP
ncbi:MAG: cytochrome c biogenesis protein CcsA [Desulfovibrionaceae bacterium]